jgi:hypothetical protein
MAVKISRTKYAFSICIFDGSKIFQKYAFFHGKMPMCIFFGLAAENAYFLDCPNQHFTELCIFDGSRAFQKYAFFQREMHFFCFLANCRQCIFHISLILFKPRFSWNYAFLMVPRFSKHKYLFHGKMHMFAFRLAAELGTSLASVTSVKNKGENARPLKLASVAATAPRVSAS